MKGIVQKEWRNEGRQADRMKKKNGIIKKKDRCIELPIVFYISDERFVYPMAQKFLCQLYSPTSWEVVPNTQ